MKEPVEILLVEDYPVDQQVALFLFKRNPVPHKVHVIRDGFEALSFVFCRGAHENRSFENPPGVILLDIRLPELDGWEVLSQIKQDSRTSGIPVVMTSAYVSTEEVEKAREMGALGCIQKPIQYDKLSNLLDRAGFASSNGGGTDLSTESPERANGTRSHSGASDDARPFGSAA